MEWNEVIEHPSLRDSPFKIELNKYGQIIMNARNIRRSAYQGQISVILQNLRQDGITLTECAIWTQKGTKCADVAWASWEVFEKIEGKTEAEVAPDICVEVLSSSNSEKEMKQKRKLYFEQGAKEVWMCNEYGDMKFYDENGKIENSLMFSAFPKNVGIRKPS